MPKPTKDKSRKGKSCLRPHVAPAKLITSTAQVIAPPVEITEHEKNQLFDSLLILADTLIDYSFLQPVFQVTRKRLITQSYKIKIRQVITEINSKCPELYLRTVTDIYDSTKPYYILRL